MATASHAQTTTSFLATITGEAQDMILAAIASHYGITMGEALAEITDPEAEALLDYLTGSTRAATSALMQKHGFR